MKRVCLVMLLVPLLAAGAWWVSFSGGHERWTPLGGGIYYVEPVAPGPLFWLCGLTWVASMVLWGVLVVRER